jgi:hypothetical protein
MSFYNNYPNRQAWKPAMTQAAHFNVELHLSVQPICKLQL